MSRPASKGHLQGRTRDHQSNVEAQRIVRTNEKDHDIGLPRLVARIWGLVSGISYVSNGGYLVVESDSSNEKCQAAGAYMIFAGLAIVIMECGCCIFQNKNNCCDSFEKRFPFWAKGILYFVSVVPALALCFGTKTLISSIIVITLALIYVFLTCLVRSKRYERLRGEARQRYQSAKSDTRFTYNTVQGVTSSINYMKMNTKNAQNQARANKAGGPSRQTRGTPKKSKTRSNTTAT